MNSDSYFDSDFFHENKSLITIVCTLSLVIISFYYIYKSLNLNESEGVENNNEINQENGNPINNNRNSQANMNTLNNIQNSGTNISKISNKKKLMINGSTVLIKDLNNIDRPLIYQFLDPLSKEYDLYIVFLVEDEKEIKIILDNLECLVEDKIIFKHVNN